MKSLWTPAVRWTAVTEEGLEGGTVISEDYDGSPQALQKVRSNIERSGQIGQLVANDFKSSIIYVPLLSRIEATGQALDYAEFARQVEALRAKHESATIRIHITGFARSSAT
ncbi:hypothetical protein Y694_03335 [Methylibium sp. T29-B]|nr:hypothetical protein Y694_03335 [Methylibium sp. T29-B]